MKQYKPRVVTDFRGQDHVQTRNICGNTTYVRNYEVEYTQFFIGVRLYINARNDDIMPHLRVVMLDRYQGVGIELTRQLPLQTYCFAINDDY